MSLWFVSIPVYINIMKEMGIFIAREFLSKTASCAGPSRSAILADRVKRDRSEGRLQKYLDLQTAKIAVISNNKLKNKDLEFCDYLKLKESLQWDRLFLLTISQRSYACL